MTFDRPEYLWLALLALPELVLAIARTPRLERSARALAGPARAAALAAGHRLASIVGLVFSVLFVLAAAMALAGPAWGSRAVTAERSGLEVAVVLDVSRSMMVGDGGTGTRLEAARETVRGLLRMSPDVAFSLVAAKGEAILLVPMTDDLEAIDSGLDYATPDTLSAVGTDLEAGIRAGLDSFTEKSGASRLVLLLSDGGEHGSEALRAADEARRRGVRVIALGLGGASPLPVPGPTGAPLLDSRGLAVRSALQSAPLKAVAQASRGRYLDAADSAARTILRAEFADSGRGGKRTVYEVQDRTGLVALLALAFLSCRLIASALALAGGASGSGGTGGSGGSGGASGSRRPEGRANSAEGGPRRAGKGGRQ